MKNWIQSWKNLIVQQKSDLSWDLCLPSIEISKYRYFYCHERSTLFDKSMLLCTKADLTTTQSIVNRQDIIRICTQERRNTK